MDTSFTFGKLLFNEPTNKKLDVKMTISQPSKSRMATSKISDITGGYERLSLNTSFVGSGSVTIMRMGHLRVLFGYIRPTNVGGNQVFALLSQSDRPPLEVCGAANAYDANAYAEIIIRSSGNANVSVNTVPNNSLKFNITYYVE